MSAIEGILGCILLVACLIIIFIVLAQEGKDQGLTSAIGGGATDTFFGKNEGRTKEAKLNRWTKFAAFIFFVLTLVVNVVVPFVTK